jgi:hypothetical protein
MMVESRMLKGPRAAVTWGAHEPGLAEPTLSC